AQFLILAHAARRPSLIAPTVAETFEQASAQGLIAPAEARRLIEARALYAELLQRERLCSTDARPLSWSDTTILGVIARHLRFGSGARLKREVEERRSEIAEIYKRIVQAVDGARLTVTRSMLCAVALAC